MPTIDPRDAEIEKLRAELAEARKVLDAVIRNDKTPPYTYNGLVSSMNAENTPPATGQRWNTPAEMARAFLARKETP